MGVNLKFLSKTILIMNSSVNVSEVKSIDQSIKDIVFGFCREAQALFSSDNVYFTIPPLIIHHCLLFYYQREYLKTNYEDIEIDERTWCIAESMETYSEQKIYGNIVIDEIKVYIWEIKVHSVITTEGEEHLEIGISPLNNESDAYEYYYDADGDKCKIWYEYYGKQYGDGDIIKIRLDVGKQTIEFIKNNESQGMAYNSMAITPDDEYSLCIKMPRKGTKVELISFHEIK